MSPAGSSSEEGLGGRLILRPTVTKTFLKGVIAVAAFSIFLQLSWATLVHYLIFLAIYFAFILFLIEIKRSSTYELGDDSIAMRRIVLSRFHRELYAIRYQDILDMSVSQGILARRFQCGTVFLILKTGKGSVRVMGGGMADQLEDVPHPEHVYEFIASRLSPYSTPIEP